MILIAKETPHMFMWFSDGSKIPAGISPLPQNTRLDYIKRLKNECAKLFITKTPVYLVYMGRLLNRKQITLLENLQNDIPNLAVIDFDEVEKRIADQEVLRKVSVAATSYKKNEKLDVGSGGIADLVDLTRLILLYNSQILRGIAQQKITIPLEWPEGLIYRDFDVTLEKEAMADIPTTYGYMATLNFQEQVQKYHTRFIESARGQQDIIEKINIFFNCYLYNLERYQQILKLFLKRPLNAEESAAKQTFISEYKQICHNDNFELTFINYIRIENSFLAISKDQHPLINKMIQEVVSRDQSPYGVVQIIFSRCFNKLDSLTEFLTPQLLGFNIGNDLTWKISVKEQHTSPNPTPLDSPQRNNTNVLAPLPPSAAPLSPSTGDNGNQHELKARITVDKLSILSKNYLDHLNNTLYKKNIVDKYQVVLTLNAILDNTSTSPSTKLFEFSSYLQNADNGILKNHREPNWAMFKQAALFLLGITIIGAIVGLVDYSLRGHHSIFFAAKSHGERFILDVDECIPQIKISGVI